MIFFIIKFTIKKTSTKEAFYFFVEVSGFEAATPCSQSRCAINYFF